MNASQPYVIISIAALLILALLAYATFRSGRPNRLTPLASLAFAFILAESYSARTESLATD